MVAVAHGKEQAVALSAQRAENIGQPGKQLFLLHQPAREMAALLHEVKVVALGELRQRLLQRDVYKRQRLERLWE